MVTYRHWAKEGKTHHVYRTRHGAELKIKTVAHPNHWVAANLGCRFQTVNEWLPDTFQ